MVKTAPHLVKKRVRNTPNNPKTKTPNPKTQKKMENYRGATVAWKSTGHSRASRFIYVTLDPPKKRAGDVNLQAPRALNGSRRSRVARRGKREFDRPRVVQKADQVYLVRLCSR